MRARLALLPLLVLAGCAALRPGTGAGERPRNVIFLIPDGYGPASATLAREVSGAPLALDGVLTGLVRTPSTSHEITDSAAAATAYACGLLTYNGAIAVDTLRQPCGTVLEAAENAGMATGLVVTTRMTHATPASYAAHVASRSSEDEIAAQMAALPIEVFFGGGRQHFQPAAAGRRGRADGRDLLADARARGAAVALDRAGFDALTTTPAWALLAENHFAYEVDRDETAEPSLAEMTRKALDLLANSPEGRARGFFVMVEGSRIDHAAHDNDVAGHVGDVLAYDAAVRVALDFARRDGRTLVVSVADHETGGLALGRDGRHRWSLAYVRAVRESAERMARRLAEGEDVADVLRTGAGVDSLGADELARIDSARAGTLRRSVSATLGPIVSRRAGVGWTTLGHTAVDVTLHAFGPGAERFRGVMGSDEVGRAVWALLGFDPAATTSAVRARLAAMGE